MFVIFYQRLVAEFLIQFGFKNVDALEPSDGMANIARSKSIYNNIYTELIQANRKTSIPDGNFFLPIFQSLFLS
jgi:hypothetical protein